MRAGIIAAGLTLLSMAFWMVYRGHGDPTPPTQPVYTNTHRPRQSGDHLNLRSPDQVGLGLDGWTAELSDAAFPVTAAALLEELKDLEYPPAMAVQARLSALFREWGRRDFAKAADFLKAEPAFNRFLLSDINRKPCDDLILAALIGHSKTDPADAWTRLLSIYNNDKLVIRRNDLWPYADESAGEDIFRSFFETAPDQALQALRLRGRESGILLDPALRAVMAETTDPEVRSGLFREFRDLLFPGSNEFPLALAGICERDPAQAWQLIYAPDRDSTRSNVVAQEVISRWSHRFPKEAFQFIASLDPATRNPLFEAYVKIQLDFHPAMVIAALDHPAFAHYQTTILTYAMKVDLMRTGFPWRLTETDPYPPDPSVRIDRMASAVTASGFPPPTKQNFLDALQAMRSALEPPPE